MLHFYVALDTFLCGSFTIKAQQQAITTDLKNTYKLYFESLR